MTNITKTEIQEMIDRLADKSLTFGCRAKLKTHDHPEFVIMELSDSGNYVGTYELGDLPVRSLQVIGHPILIGDVLEKMAFNWAKKAIDEHLHNTIWILEKEQADLLKLWQPCGFAKSLQQIFEEAEWEWFDCRVNCPEPCCVDCMHVPKQPALRDLFIFLKDIEL